MTHKKRSRPSLTEDEIKKYSRFLVLPLFVLILIVVILLVDRSPKREPVNALPESKATASDAVVSEAETYSAAELAEEEITGIHDLIERYFQAKTDCDPAAIEAVFGNKNPGDLTELQEKLNREKESIEGYQDIVCYTKPGLEEGSYVVYVQMNVKFYTSQTLAPGVVSCYVKTNEEGNFYIVEDMEQRVQDYMAYVDESEDVIQLRDQVDADLRTALASDGDLVKTYEVLMKGAYPDMAATASDAEESGAEDGSEGGSEPAAAESQETETEESAE